jgi:hypothetical protein
MIKPYSGATPYRQRQTYGPPVEGSDVVEFRLLYSGRLLGASRVDTRPQMKHAVRRELHPQLKRLWKTHTNLRLFPENYVKAMAVEKHFPVEQPDGSFNTVPGWDDWYKEFKTKTEEQRFADGIEIIQKQWERCGYKFVPLVTEKLCLRCSIEILFLRPDEPGQLIKSGDLDARIKTIFDALRMPTNLDEAGGQGPQDGEEPFYCLLEDDKLVADITVVTDQLLLLPKEKEINPHDVFLVINVKLKPHGTPQDFEWVFS